MLAVLLVDCETEAVCISTVTCRTFQFCLFLKLNSVVVGNHGILSC